METAKLTKTQNWLVVFIAIVFLVVVPVGNLLGVIPTTTVNLWGRYFSYAIVALGIDLIWGYTGIMSLCQAIFFCMGGYAIAMHMTMVSSTQVVNGSILPDFMVWNQVEDLPFFWEPFNSFPLAVVLALLVPAVVAGVFGYFVFRSRIKGVYFAVITQALALAMWLLFLRNETMLGGTNGLTAFKSLLGFNLADPNVKLGMYVLTFCILGGTYFISRKIIHSKLGRVLIAIRDSEHRLRYTGYSVTAFKLFVFVFAAVLAAIGGVLYVPQTGIITPGKMDVQISIEMLIWVAVGGRGSLVGAVIGAIVINLLYSVMTSLFPGSWLFVLGFIFIGVVLFYDKGIIGLFLKRQKPFRLALPFKKTK